MKPKILFLWPTEIPYDLNLIYHYTVFGETAAYFLNNKKYEVDIFDGGVLEYLKKEYVSVLLKKQYDYLVIISYIQSTKAAVEAAELCRLISPKTKILAYGSSCYYVPHVFEKEPFDAYIHEGDFEPAIESYIKYNEKEIVKNELKGVCIENGKYKAPAGWLDPDKWALPPLDNLPLDAFEKIINQKASIKRFGSRQVGVTVTKGCPFACPFCVASRMFGKTERRRPVDTLIKFIKENTNKFDVWVIFASNFTLNREWVEEFCHKIIENKIKIDWRCTTRASLLDQEIIDLMAKAGCKSVGIGVETFQKNVQKNINKIIDKNQVIETFKKLVKAGITAKGYIMLGIPGQTKNDIRDTVKSILEVGGEIRPSSYSPYQDLNDKSSLDDISKMDRYSYKTNSIKCLSPRDYFKIVFERDYSSLK